jgi:UDP-N-acetyl-2-amino-2-deoxyglucuronate dehydrogenase
MTSAQDRQRAPVRWGIVGAGMIAGYHAQAIRATEGAELVAVCRSQGGDTAEAAARFGVVCEPSYEALLLRSDIDVISICTPSGDHAPQAIAAACAGKHVLVEKPMALDVADADAMIEACRQNDVLLAVALQRRTMPAFRAVRDAIAAGELGRLVLGTVSVPYRREAAYYRSADWRGTWAMDGGGALMNQGIHLVDLLLWFMDDDAADVRAHATTLVHPIEVEDCVTASIRFDNGALGSVVATTAAAPGFPHRVEVYGDRGGVQIEGERVVRWETVDHTGERRVVSGASDGAPEAAGAGANPSGISVEGHTRIVENLVEAIRTKRPPMITGEEGRRSLALVRAIYDAGWNA